MSTFNADALIGRWTTDPNDENSIREFGRVSLLFGADGKLTYRIHGETKDEIVLLTYRVEGDYIVTNQPSDPHEEQTEFKLFPDGRLALKFGGLDSQYIREQIDMTK